MLWFVEIFDKDVVVEANTIEEAAPLLATTIENNLNAEYSKIDRKYNKVACNVTKNKHIYCKFYTKDIYNEWALMQTHMYPIGTYMYWSSKES